MSWLSISPDSHFSIANIPFGIISTDASEPRPAVAIGEYALDLKAFAAGHGFSQLPSIQDHLNVFAQPTLNALSATGVHREVRRYVQSILRDDTSHPHILKSNQELRESALIPLSGVKTHLPFHIGDYTDFYAGLNHAFNVGVLFRGADNALQPNYSHLPVGYHGRASTIVTSGTPLRRPRGQILPQPGAKEPVFSPCKRLDIELELGAFVSKPNEMGRPVKIDDAQDHIFGLVLMNDWSARDIQAWEYVPLGPFNSKNFGTTISPWVVLPDALEPFRTEALQTKDQQLLQYLQESQKDNVYDIKLEVELKPKGASQAETMTRTSAKNLMYSFPQMLAHHTITGCAMNTGDLLGSGTISGSGPGTQGSLLEQTKNGKEAITIGSVKRTFLEDGDEVTIRGVCGKAGSYVGFGPCSGTILPALED